LATDQIMADRLSPSGCRKIQRRQAVAGQG
jgi:hypothetical protein